MPESQLIVTNKVWAIVDRYNRALIASLWGTQESAEEQLRRERERYDQKETDDQYEVVQIAVGDYV